jgi:hypothetical protein
MDSRNKSAKDGFLLETQTPIVIAGLVPAIHATGRRPDAVRQIYRSFAALNRTAVGQAVE